MESVCLLKSPKRQEPFKIITDMASVIIDVCVQGYVRNLSIGGGWGLKVPRPP